MMMMNNNKSEILLDCYHNLNKNFVYAILEFLTKIIFIKVKYLRFILINKLSK